MYAFSGHRRHKVPEAVLDHDPRFHISALPCLALSVPDDLLIVRSPATTAAINPPRFLDVLELSPELTEPRAACA